MKQSHQSSSLRASRQSQSGYSIVQVLVALGMMAVLISSLVASQINMMKTNNFLEYQMNRTQLSGAISGLFLRNPANCGCLFQGADGFNAAGIAQLRGVNPRAIGRFNFTGSGACAGIPEPLINTQGIDGMRMISVHLNEIRPVGGEYSGVFSVLLESLKTVSGPSQIKIDIPVHVEVATVPGGRVAFRSCSDSGGSGQTTWVPGAPIFYCAAGGDTWKCGPTTGVQSPNWTNIDLKPLGVPGAAKSVTIRSYVVEAQLFVKKANDPSPVGFRNRVVFAQNNYGGMNDVKIDMEGSNGILSYATDRTNPPTYDAMLQLISYEE